MNRHLDRLEADIVRPPQRDNDHGILKIIPESAGPRVVTPGGGVIYSLRPPGSQTVLSENHFAEVILAPSPKIRAALASDRLREYDFPAGTLVIQPAHVEGRIEWSFTKESLIVALRTETFADLGLRELDLSKVELQPPSFGTVDRTAWRIAELLKMELARHEPASELYIDSLITLFGIHLLRTYCGTGKQLAKAKGGLSVSSARRVQEYIKENFARALSVDELAAISDLSPYHFIRAFTKTFGQSPHQYVIMLRLISAGNMLIETDLTIAEIAYLTGFSSQSHLTSTMRKYQRMTPAEIRLRR